MSLQICSNPFCSQIKPTLWPAQTPEFNAEGIALILLSLPDNVRRAVAREQARSALRDCLGFLLHLPASAIALHETATGPTFVHSSHAFHLSLSYAGNQCLIGISKKFAIGVDIVRIEPIPELNALTHLYLPQAACAKVIHADEPEKAATFALAWAQMEASSKCLGLPLAEMSAQREQTLATCMLFNCHQTGNFQIALATRQPV